MSNPNNDQLDSDIAKLDKLMGMINGLCDSDNDIGVIVAVLASSLCQAILWTCDECSVTIVRGLEERMSRMGVQYINAKR
jgi:hypothetical protein